MTTKNRTLHLVVVLAVWWGVGQLQRGWGLSKGDLGSRLVVVEAVDWRWSTGWWTVIAGDGSGSPAATWQW